MTLRLCLPWKKRVSARPCRRRIVDLCALESRALATVSGLTAQTSLVFLQHQNPVNQPKFYRTLEIAPVTIAGMVNDNLPTPPSIHFQVIDQYGLDQPSGTITPQAYAPGKYLYSTRIGLSLRHRPGGRKYLIVVTAQDATSSETATAPAVVVPKGRL
jgi:hypothetical protein